MLPALVGTQPTQLTATYFQAPVYFSLKSRSITQPPKPLQVIGQSSWKVKVKVAAKWLSLNYRGSSSFGEQVANGDGLLLGTFFAKQLKTSHDWHSRQLLAER